MPPSVVQELGAGRLLLDLGFRDREGIIASFLIPEPEDRWALVETGPTSCLDRLAVGVGRAGIDPAQVGEVFVTHVHLDHAGGAGAILQRFPRAALYVHRAGLPHLLDPSRLVASARRAWGEASDQLWGAVEPVPADRAHALDGEERFPVSGGELRVVATPGHARHHVSLYDSATGAILTGDSAGVRLPGGWRPRPAVPPPDLDVEELLASVERMERLAPRAVWFTHFGPSPDGAADLRRYREAVREWTAVALEAARGGASVSSVARALQRAEEEAAARASVPPPPDDKGALISGYELAAQGLLRYFRTRGLTPE